jgi:hypothetical protein
MHAIQSSTKGRCEFNHQFAILRWVQNLIGLGEVYLHVLQTWGGSPVKDRWKWSIEIIVGTSSVGSQIIVCQQPKYKIKNNLIKICPQHYVLKIYCVCLKAVQGEASLHDSERRHLEKPGWQLPIKVVVVDLTA